MNCPNCNAPLQTSAQNCPACGTPLIEGEAPIRNLPSKALLGHRIVPLGIASAIIGTLLLVHYGILVFLCGKTAK